MCYFITGLLGPGVDAAKVRQIAAPFRIQWSSIDNPAIRKQLRLGETYYYTTWGMCDCGTTVGSRNTDSHRPRNYSRKVAKLLKQGWSEAKIARWMSDQEAVAARQEREKAERGSVQGANNQEWTAFVQEVLSEQVATSIGILLHFYSHSVDDEPFGELKTLTIPCGQLSPETFANVQEDVIYRFTSSTTKAASAAPG